MIQFQSLLSSSSGNATYVTDGVTSILIDCGASAAYIDRCLARLKAESATLSGIFLTHHHSDHIGAAGVMARKYKLPLFGTEPTFQSALKKLGDIKKEQVNLLLPDTDIAIGTLKVHAFSIPHDCEGAVSYTVADKEDKFGIATDSGCITSDILENLSGASNVIVESNHDIDMLKNGPYPFPLKKRILSDLGHLSNERCGELCVALAKTGTKAFWLGHLSDHNNLPELAYSCVRQALTENGFSVGGDVALNVIPKYWIGASV